ncbi:cytochrome c oxidase subunit II [Mucilaginibacter koreensis]
MGFKKYISSNKFLSLLTVFMLGATALMAQGTASSNATATADQSAQTAGMWTTVAYYVVLVVLAGVIIGIVGKILRIYDLTLQMQGKKGIDWNKSMAVGFILFLLAGLVGVYYSFTVHGSMILPESASAHGKTLDTMFWVTFGITVIVFFATQILLFGFAYKYRGQKTRKAYYYPHNNTIEKAWTITPAIVLAALVIFGFFSWRKITNTVDAKGEPASLQIDVTGHQFAWEIRYPGHDGKLGLKDYKLISGTNVLGVNFKDRNSFDDLRTDTIVLPVNKSVRLNILAQDVIHSVYMPNFRVQINAVPGLPTYFKFTPTITTEQMRRNLDDQTFDYHLYCNKICGGGHYNMQKLIKVVTQEEYYTWLAHQKPYLSEQLKKELKFADNVPAVQPTKEQIRLALNN